MILTFIRNEKRRKRKQTTPRRDESYHPPPFTFPSCPFGSFVFQRETLVQSTYSYPAIPQSRKASRCKNALVEPSISSLPSEGHHCEDSSFLIASFLNFSSSDSSLYKLSSCILSSGLTSSFMFISSFSHGVQAAAS